MLHFGSRDCLKTAFGPRRRQSLLRMRDRVLRDLFSLSRCGSAQSAAGIFLWFAAYPRIYKVSSFPPAILNKKFYIFEIWVTSTRRNSGQGLRGWHPPDGWKVGGRSRSAH